MERAVHLYDCSDHRLYCLAVRGTSLEAEVLVVQHERVSAHAMVAQAALVAAAHPRAIAVAVSHHLEYCCRYCICLAGVVMARRALTKRC
jgi:hypothetical protein